MHDFNYGNARLHAWKSRLLSRSELESLTEVGSQQGLITALTRTAYCRAVEASLARATGTDCVIEALCNDLVNSLAKVRSFFNGRAGEMIAIVLRRYDVHNLKAILRGLAKNAPSDQILPVLLPVGDIDNNQFLDLVRAPGPRGAIDLLASMNLPISWPLLKLRAEHPGAGVFEMELALDQWYFHQAFEYVQNTRQDKSLLASAFDLDADLTNLLTMLRFASMPAEHRLLQERLGTKDLSRLLVGPGILSFAILANSGSQKTLEAAVEVLSKSPYGPALKAGLTGYLRSGLLSDFEKQLGYFRLGWMAKQIPKDPLGIGVFLGYLALKLNEISNIRWIAQGIRNGLMAQAIREELVFSP